MPHFGGVLLERTRDSIVNHQWNARSIIPLVACVMTEASLGSPA